MHSIKELDLPLGVMRMVNRQRAVSTIVATILTINMAIVMGGVMIAWAMGLIGSYQGGTQVQYMLMGEKMQEAIVIENVWFQTGTPKKITVFVRNVGVREAKLASLYVDGTSYTNASWPYTLPVGSAIVLQITDFNWAYGSSYLIVVATARGNQARGEWTP